MKLEEAKQYLGQKRIQRTDDGEFIRECVGLGGEITIRADGEQEINIDRVWMTGRWEMETWTSLPRWKEMLPCPPEN